MARRYTSRDFVKAKPRAIERRPPACRVNLRTELVGCASPPYLSEYGVGITHLADAGAIRLRPVEYGSVRLLNR